MSVGTAIGISLGSIFENRLISTIVGVIPITP
jgi:hypothetical protein